MSRAWRMPFGMHKGQLLADVPAEYLQWLGRQKLSGRFAEGVARELVRRGLRAFGRRETIRAPGPLLAVRAPKSDPCGCPIYAADGTPNDDEATDAAGRRVVRCRACGKIWRRLDGVE